MIPDEDVPADETEYNTIVREGKKYTETYQDEHLDTNNPAQKETEKDKKTLNNNTPKAGGFLFQILMSTVYNWSNDKNNVKKNLLIPSRCIKRKKLKYGRQNKKKKKDNRYKGSRHHKLFYDKAYGVLFIVCGLIGNSNCKIEVTLLNEPVVFGDNVTLICSCDKYVEKGHAWTKGNDFKQLTLGGSSNDTGKYKPLLSKDSDRYLYGLKITNFSIEDLDNYNCQFGFEKTSYKLSLDKRFAYIPRNNDIIPKVSLWGRSLNMTILIKKVYPDPECYLSVQGYNLTNEARIINKKSSKFYEAIFRSDWLSSYAETNCTVVVSLNCTLSTSQFYHRRNVTVCKENANRSSNGTGDIMMIIIPLVIVSCLIAMVALFVLIYKRRGTNNCFRRTTFPAENLISELLKLISR